MKLKNFGSPLRSYFKSLNRQNSPTHKKYGKKASQGMTAAIILIAFIITAAGIAFVILTLGAEMQVELGNTAESGKDAATSMMQIEGNVITGWGSSNTIQAYAFNVRLVLNSGEISLATNAITVWVSINHGEETEYTGTGLTTTLQAAAGAGNSGKYGIAWPDGSGSTLSAGEMARFLIGSANNTIAPRQSALIVINSASATLKIQIDIGAEINDGVNFL